MKLPTPAPRRKAEPTITLINVVFLMLIFFLVAGTLAPPMDSAISMIETSEAERIPPSEALSVRSDGSLFFKGRTVSLEEWANSDIALATRESGEAPKLIADRELPAPDLVAIITEMRGLGFERVSVVTERAGG